MTVEPFTTWILAALCAAVITSIAWRLRSLALSGAIAAAVMGTTVVGMGGWWPGIILVVFFATSSAISRLGAPSNHQARGARRDWVQVMANGWTILLGCLFFAISGSPIWLLFGIGGISAATADTWSSELGRRSSSPPRLVTTGRVVPAGTSGGVSGFGLLASVAGAALIGMLTALSDIPTSLSMVLGIALAGFTGGLVDSLLGATIQERRYCDHCCTHTESNPHRCGTTTRIIGGVSYVNNDVVNIACAFTGAIIAAISGILFL